jgi:hypothetical protein
MISTGSRILQVFFLTPWLPLSNVPSHTRVLPAGYAGNAGIFDFSNMRIPRKTSPGEIRPGIRGTFLSMRFAAVVTVLKLVSTGELLFPVVDTLIRSHIYITHPGKHLR